jgi:hypothetical protein
MKLISSRINVKFSVQLSTPPKYALYNAGIFIHYQKNNEHSTLPSIYVFANEPICFGLNNHYQGLQQNYYKICTPLHVKISKVKQRKFKNSN